MFKKVGNKKIYLSIMGISLIIAVFFISTAFSKQDVVASVDGKEISKNDLYDVLVGQYGPEALSALIDNKIIEMEADKKKVTVSDKEIDAELQVYTDSYGGEEALQSVLDQTGITVDALKTDIESYIKLEKLLEPLIEITDEELQAYFEENKESFNEPEQVQASHILLEDEATANEVAERLAAEEDFTELAKEYSTDTATAANGGELGYFTKGEMAEEFENKAFSMEIDSISEPVKTEFGYHIIKVTDKKDAKEPVYEDNKEEINEIIYNEKIQTEYITWMEEKKAEYNIVNTLVKE